jgi:ATP-dependent helicase/nuclease subunit A
MKKADACGKLRREQPFVISRPACEIFPDRKEKEPVLIQGIMDGYYETAEGLVLMDYKTDSLQKGDEHILVERYRTQMDLYKKALETMMGMPVQACFLYSFSLGRTIRLPE